MKKIIRKIVLEMPILRELFFYVKGHKTNVKKIDKLILSIDTINLQKKKMLSDCIISLTSYGARISELQYTLYSLIQQTVKPSKIVVYISEQDFNNIPDNLLVFQKYGIEFHKTKDYKSYKKLIPALIEFGGYNIVTADDDLFYPKDWLENLYNEHVLYPYDVICQQFIKVTYDKKISSFKDWIINPHYSNDLRSMCQLGGSGTLYPVNSLYKDVSNYELISRIAPYSDDIWFYFMCILNKTRIRQVKNPWKNLRYVNVYREYGIVEGKTLTQINVAGGKNDEQFRNILAFYDISDERLIRFYEGEIDSLI